MKKMLAKAIALSVIMGGMSFVANDAQAYVPAGTDMKGYVRSNKPGQYELVEKQDIQGIKNNAEAAKKAADQAKKAVKKEEAERKDADKKIQGRIDKVEADSKAADAKLNDKITAHQWDTAQKFAKVQEQFDNQKVTDAEQDKKIEANKTAIEQEAKDRVAKDDELDGKITTEKNERIAADEAEKEAREAADDQLQKNINEEAATRESEDKRIEAKFDGEVARLDSRIDKLDKKIEKVGAMAAAIANLHTMGYDPAAPTEIAVGVGQYRDKTGVALGAFHYPNRDFMLSFSVSTAGDEYMGGIGATWKFGRKTPEEMRQAEHEKAVKAKAAKAEAAKKAAKDARVAAQQQRHAEMLAARTAK